MKILSKIKGFVTNSSSANYWLNDGVVEIGRNPESGNAPQGDAVYKKANFENLFIWLFFSVVLLVIIFTKTIFRPLAKIQRNFDREANICVIGIAIAVSHAIVIATVFGSGLHRMFVGAYPSAVLFSIALLPLFAGVFLSAHLAKKLFFPKGVKNASLYIVLLTIAFVFMHSSVVAQLSKTRYENAMAYLSESWYDGSEHEETIAFIFANDGNDDIILYLGGVRDEGFKRIFAVAAPVFFGALLLLLAHPDATRKKFIHNILRR